MFHRGQVSENQRPRERKYSKAVLLFLEEARRFIFRDNTMTLRRSIEDFAGT